MIDASLLISAVAAFIAFYVGSRVGPLRVLPRPVLFDAALAAALTGVFSGRLVALAFDDPRSVLAPRDFLLVRGGVEFWPGVAAATATFLFITRHEVVPRVDKLADVLPAALVGYGAYEAACLARGGCFGPVAPLGLRPAGLATAMVPIGVLVAVFVAGIAVVVHRLAARRPSVAVAVAVAGVAAARAAAGFGLPRVGTDLSRPHVTSIAVAALASAVAVALWRSPTVSSGSPGISTTTATPLPIELRDRP